MIKAWFVDEIGRTYTIEFESEEKLEQFIEENKQLRFIFSEGTM